MTKERLKAKIKEVVRERAFLLNKIKLSLENLDLISTWDLPSAS